MPFRVPEGPVDPYDPFPLDEAGPSWTAAPIIRGRDVGFDVPTYDAGDAVESADAEFVELDVEPDESPADLFIFEEDLVEDLAADNDGTWPDVRLHHIGDGFDGWAVVNTTPSSSADEEEVDPWAVIGPESPSSEAEESEAPETTALDAVVRPGGPPLSSKAILAIGVLALTCLALAAALAFQAIGHDEPPALDARPAEAGGVAVEASTVPPRAIREALPVSDTTLTGIERAAMGPLEGELDRLALALQDAFGHSSAEVAPVLQPYIAHAAQRMRTHPARFVLAVTAPDPVLASARADGILRAFEGAGLPADMLRMTATAGLPSVRFER